MTPVHLVPLTTVRSPFEAKVLTALLGAEGIVWQASGNLDSVYPIGVVEVRVAAEDLDRARDLLDAAPCEADEDEVDDGAARWVGLALLAFVVLWVVLRMATVG